MSMLGSDSNSNNNRDKKIEDLINKTSRIEKRLEHNNVNNFIQLITNKIRNELKFDNDSRLENMGSTLKDGLRENARSIHQLER